MLFFLVGSQSNFNSVPLLAVYNRENSSMMVHLVSQMFSVSAMTNLHDFFLDLAIEMPTAAY